MIKQMQWRFLLTLVALQFLMSINVYADTPRFLQLGDAISIALEKSYDMKVVRLERLSAEKNLISAKSNFKMRVDANFDLPSWNESVQETYREGNLPVYETRGNYRYQGNLNVTQPLPTDGQVRLQGRSYYGGVSFWDNALDKSVTRNDLLTSLSLQFSQPLFTLNSLKTNLKQADLGYERAVKRYTRQELDIVYRVTSGFYAFYRATRELEIARDDVQQQEELADLAQKKFDAGLIPEVEALQLQVDYAESQNALVAADAALARISDSFKQLIGLTFSENIGVITNFDFNKVTVDLAQAVDFALEERAEVRLNEISIELAELRMKEIDAFRDFNGTLSGFYDLTGVANSDVWNTTEPQSLWGRSLDDMQKRPNNRGIIFSLNVPLFDFGGNKAAVQSAEADLRSTELTLSEMKKTIEREVRDATGRLYESQSQLDVLKKREELAKRAIDISVERFNNGDITSQALALDRDRYILSQIAYLNSYINYQVALADLKRKTMYDFEYGHSLVD
jgi:outer membrane protein